MTVTEGQINRQSCSLLASSYLQNINAVIVICKNHTCCDKKMRKMSKMLIESAAFGVSNIVLHVWMLHVMSVWHFSQWTRKFQRVMLRLATTLGLRTWWFGVTRMQSAHCPTFCSSFSVQSSTSRAARISMTRWDSLLFTSRCFMCNRKKLSKRLL